MLELAIWKIPEEDPSGFAYYHLLYKSLAGSSIVFDPMSFDDLEAMYVFGN